MGRGEASPLHERGGLRPEAASREPALAEAWHASYPIPPNGTGAAVRDFPHRKFVVARADVPDLVASLNLAVRAVNHYDKLVSALRELDANCENRQDEPFVAYVRATCRAALETEGK